MVERFGMIDEASGHEPLYFGRTTDLAPHGIAGEEFVRLADYATLESQLQAAEKRVEELTAERDAYIRACDSYEEEIKETEATVAEMRKALEEIANPAMGSHGCVSDEELHAYWRGEAIRHRSIAKATLTPKEPGEASLAAEGRGA
jgi:multidrug resistance efflux pump